MSKDNVADLPFRCKFCGNRFDSSHRLPENHDCLGLAKWKKKRINSFQRGKVPITYESVQQSRHNDRKWNRRPSIRLRMPYRGHSHTPSIYASIILIIALFSPVLSINLFGQDFNVGNFYALSKGVITNTPTGLENMLNVPRHIDIIRAMVVLFFIGLFLYIMSGLGFYSKKLGSIATVSTIGYVVAFLMLITDTGGNFSNSGLNLLLSIAAVIVYFWSK